MRELSIYLISPLSSKHAARVWNTRENPKFHTVYLARPRAQVLALECCPPSPFLLTLGCFLHSLLHSLLYAPRCCNHQNLVKRILTRLHIKYVFWRIQVRSL